MKDKINIIFESFNILEKKTIISFIFIAISSIFISFLELAGIGFIGSFMMLLTDTDSALNTINKYKIFSFLENFSKTSILEFFLFFIIVFFVVKNFIIFIYIYIFNKFRLIVTFEISKKVFQENIENNYEYFLKQKKSKIIHDIREETNKFTGVFFSILNLIKDIVLIIFLASSIFVVNWKLSTIIFVLFLIFSILIFQFIKKKLYILGKNITKFSSKFLKKLLETFNNIKFIKIRNLEKFITKDIYFFQKKILYTSFLQGLIIAIPRLALEIFAVSSLCFAIYFYINSDIPIIKLIPLLSFIALSVIRMVPAVTSINQNINNIVSNSYSLEVILNYFKIGNKSKYKFNDNNPIIKEKIKTLKFENVSFKYDSQDSNFSIKNLNIDLNQNDILGVIGPSGGGKTTFADLTLGLLKPKSGGIFINGKNLDYNLFDISCVPQSINLLDETLHKNISFETSVDKIDLEKMRDAIINADLTNLENKLYNQKIGEDGILLSGGQKQRIGIARAFYNKPNLLILDEPTSELDYKSEEKIMSNLKNQKIDLIILIAHRLNTLNICNKLVIFDDGKVSDFGKKDEILKKYKELSHFFHKNK